ncbi:MAG: glycosyltransferase family 2 protein, partial [Bacteroidetes bacterium]
MNISTLIDILQLLTLIYFGFSAFYLLLFAVSSFFYKNNSKVDESVLRKFLILIPAYKEDKVIINTTTEALKQNYPSNLYDIYVIADSFDTDTLKVLNEKEGINCIEVSFEHSTKARSINKALDIITDEYDGVIILDADNIMEANFIQKI